MNHTVVVAGEYFELMAKRGIWVCMMSTAIEFNREKLFDEPYWTIDELRASISDNVRFSVRSVFNDDKTLCAAGEIEFPTNITGLLSLPCHGVQ